MKKIADGIINTSGGTIMPEMVDDKAWPKAVRDLVAKNVYCPEIRKIMFNVKTEDWKRDENGKPAVDKKTGKKSRVRMASPTLATIVEFEDDSRVTVINSDHDKIELVKDKETGVVTASDKDKETAVVYAIVKKIYGVPELKMDASGRFNRTGNIDGNGFGRRLRDWVRNAWDQPVQEKLAEMKNAERKAKAAERKAKPRRRRRMTLAEAMDKLGDTLKEVEDLKAKIASMQPDKDKRGKAK